MRRAAAIRLGGALRVFGRGVAVAQREFGRAAVIALAAVVLAGCGAEDEPAAAPAPRGDFGPTQPGSGERARPVAPPVRDPAAAVADALAAGTVGVVGVEGEVGVRPETLEVSADGTLEGIEWERWEDTAAVGSGRLRLSDCDPTCATGGVDVVRARVRLSQPRLCGRVTYFDRAEVTIPGAEPPATYVRAPC